MSTIFLPIEFDSTNAIDRLQKLNLVVRLCFTIGLGRKEINNICIVNNIDSDCTKKILDRYDYLIDEKNRNQKLNLERKEKGLCNAKTNKKDNRAYKRLGKVDIDIVFSLMKEGKPLEYLGHTIPLTSKRYKCYARNGVTCIRCGKVAAYFAIERNIYNASDKYHLNLYYSYTSGKKNGKEVMLTVDHIIPKARGGADTVDNLQPMCTHCNCAKGSMLESEWEKAQAQAQAQGNGNGSKKSLIPSTECDKVCAVDGEIHMENTL